MEPYRHKVQYYETDKMGVVHHSNYIRWFEEARVDFMEKVGYSYDRMERDGVVSPVIGVTCDYKSPVDFSQQVEIEVRVVQITGSRLTIGYRGVDAQSGDLRAVGETRHCFLGENGRPISVKRLQPAFYKALVEACASNGESGSN